MGENVVTRYDPHFHLGMRVMTLIWCFRGWQVCYLDLAAVKLSPEFCRLT